MKRTIQVTALLLAVAILVAPAYAGNSRRIGTAGAQELRIPVGTRGLALGGATVASNHGVESIYYNPAGLGAARGTEVLFSNTNYLADMKVRYFALAARQGGGVLGVNAKVLDVGDLYVTTVNAPEGTGEVKAITFATLGLSYARYVTDEISFGLTGNYVSESVLSATARGLAFDLGLHYDSRWHGTKFGLAMKNLGANMRFSGSDFEYSLRLPGDDPQASNRTVSTLSSDFELPSYFQMGGEIRAWQQGDNIVTAYGGFQSNNFSDDEGRGGMEYSYRDILMLRGGYAYSGQSNYMYGPAFGVGLNIPVSGSWITVDYAFQSVDSWFDDVHTFSAKFSF
jgi:hypothetical protein